MFDCTGDLIPGVAFGAHKLVLWRFRESPIGPAAALGRVDPEGRLTLVAPAPAIADLLRVWHRVHDVLAGDVRVRGSDGPTGRRLRISAEPADAAPIEVELDLADTLASRALNLSLAWTLPCVRESEVFVRAASPLAAALLGAGRGRRLAGITEVGTPIVVAARRVTPITGGRASIGGADCGALRPIDDPPDWGEVIMPRTPQLLACRIIVRAACPDLARRRAPEKDPSCARA
jgi:hypothetical protein